MISSPFKSQQPLGIITFTPLRTMPSSICLANQTALNWRISPMATSVAAAAAATATAFVKAVMIVYFLSKRVRLVRLFEPYLGGATWMAKERKRAFRDPSGSLSLPLFLSCNPYCSHDGITTPWPDPISQI